ncbi:MAG: hypothetical protein ABSE68_02075 [Minisyncoccia bacterium]
MSTKKIRLSAGTALIFFFLFLLSFHATNAQVGISLFPIKFNITIEPGRSYSDTVTVINPNDFSIGVKPEIENISGGDEGSIDLIDTDIPHGLTAWISINKDSFDLGPQERRQIPFAINVPENGEPGGHYGAILFRSIPPAGGAVSGVGISGRVGSVVLVNVPGQTSAIGAIENFVGPDSFVSHGPVNFSFKIKNTGNTHFEPKGNIILTGPFMGKIEVPFDSRIVFPDHDRTFTAVWDNKYGFGPITANLNITIGDSGAQSSSLTFFMFPWQEALVVIAMLCLIWFGWRSMKKKFRIVRVKETR